MHADDWARLSPLLDELLELDEDEVHLSSTRLAIRRIQRELRKHVPEGVSLVDELIAERRAEAAREDDLAEGAPPPPPPEKIPVRSERNLALARGSRITVYRPGSIARAFRLRRALSAAVFVRAAGSIMERSLIPVIPAQPEPVPSGVRQVRMKLVSATR